jgi:hypothetical protein
MTETTEYSTCRSCGSRIWWALTEGGRRMPIDADPDPDGNIVPIFTASGARRVRVLTGADLPAQRQAWRTHLATCPDAPQHRARRHPPGPRCRACQLPMDPWLVSRGRVYHVNCAPPTPQEKAAESLLGEAS